MSDHLQFDTDFLNNSETSSKPKTNAPKPPGDTGGGKDALKKWGTGAAIVFGIIMISVMFDDSSSTYTPSTPTETQASGNTFTYDGQTFRCLDNHYNRAL